MKNINKWIVGLILIVGATVFIGNREENDEVVGVLLPLSSDFAWWGETIRNSISVAQDRGLLDGYQFVFQDTKCNSKDAVSGTQALKSLYPDMHLFIVGCDNDLKAMFPLLDKEKDLSFMVGLSGSDLYSGGHPVINLAHRLEDEARAAAKFSFDKLGLKRAGIITDNGGFGAVLASSFSEYFTEKGGSVVIEKVKYNESSPDTSILKILQHNPDVIYLQNDIPGLSIILRKLKLMNFQGKRVVYYGGHDQALIDTAGSAAEGAYIPWVISDESNSERDNFVAKYKEKFAKDPFVTAYFVYDGFLLLDEAVRNCSDNTKCIEKYFYDRDDFVGTLGRVKYERGGQVNRDFNFQQIREGEFISEP